MHEDAHLEAAYEERHELEHEDPEQELATWLELEDDETERESFGLELIELEDEDEDAYLYGGSSYREPY